MLEIMVLKDDGERLFEFQSKNKVNVVPRVGEIVTYKTINENIKGEVVSVEHEIYGGQEKHEIFVYINLDI